MLPMALYNYLVVTALLLALLQLSTCHVLKGSVTCLDCHQHDDLSGIKVAVKCSEVKKLSIATTKTDGSFKTELPSDTPTSKCLARIQGGSAQLYTTRKNMGSTVVRAPKSDSYTISKPLHFYTSCPKDGKCGPTKFEFGSSKTFDLPLPPEWGLAPSSYYMPFFPIIGIP